MSTTNSANKRLIVNGPSINQLIDALRYAYAAKGIRQLARFTINDAGKNREILIRITGVCHEGTSGHNFTFEGFSTKGGSTIEVFTQGVYDPNTRKGTVINVF
ncbi:MAG: hypothetical protein ACK5MU_00020 [Candidatus Saccharimonadales bacterium]